MEGDPNVSPASSGGPDAMPAQTWDHAATALPQVLDLTQAQSLRDKLLVSLGQQSVTLDGADIERMSTPCAQVLLAAGRSAAAAGVPFRILNASAVFRSALADLGLQQAFSKWME